MKIVKKKKKINKKEKEFAPTEVSNLVFHYAQSTSTVMAGPARKQKKMKKMGKKRKRLMFFQLLVRLYYFHFFPARFILLHCFSLFSL